LLPDTWGLYVKPNVDQYANNEYLKFCPIFFMSVKTWLLTLWEECRVRVFENRVFRSVFGPKRDEITGMEKNT
jgi:hypothetical protein